MLMILKLCRHILLKYWGFLFILTPLVFGRQLGSIGYWKGVAATEYEKIQTCSPPLSHFEQPSKRKKTHKIIEEKETK